jgi:hypothetical protein
MRGDIFGRCMQILLPLVDNIFLKFLFPVGCYIARRTNSRLSGVVSDFNEFFSKSDV